MIEPDDLTDENVAAWLYGFLGSFEPRDNPGFGPDDDTAKYYYAAALAMLRRQGGVTDDFLADDMLGKALEAIQKAAKTGRIGDGKIFISTIEEAIRIRTGETGADAV